MSVDKYVSEELLDCKGIKIWVRLIDKKASMDHFLVHEHFSLPMFPPIMNLPNGAICLDIGAHIGIYALRLLRDRPDYHIIALEPEPWNYGYLIKNRNTNQPCNLYPFQLALGPIESIITLHNYGNTGSWSKQTTINLEPLSDISAYAVTIEQVLDMSPFGHIDFIKLDIEGMEWEVLKSIPDDIIDNLLCLDIDMHRVHNQDIRDFFTKRDFLIQEVPNWTTRSEGDKWWHLKRPQKANRIIVYRDSLNVDS